MKDAIKEIMDNIKDDNTINALKIAQEKFPNKAKELQVLFGSYKRLKKQFEAGALSIEKYNEGIAGISLRLIDTLDELDTDPIGEVKKSNPIKRLISFQMEFLKDVISDFSRSKLILLATLAFVIIIGVTVFIQIQELMPTTLGKALLVITLIAFFTLIISSLGFLNVQIEQFKGTKSFLKFQEYSDQES